MAVRLTIVRISIGLWAVQNRPGQNLTASRKVVVVGGLFSPTHIMAHCPVAGPPALASAAKSYALLTG